MLVDEPRTERILVRMPRELGYSARFTFTGSGHRVGIEWADRHEQRPARSKVELVEIETGGEAMSSVSGTHTAGRPTRLPRSAAIRN